mmetsp:Transcript_39281/g.82588  ORF Transcript_39281/g.82588 Transcript_39281/m.82588 type:complete len:255 (+) Transcript_39281:138-902(+)
MSTASSSLPCNQMLVRTQAHLQLDFAPKCSSRMLLSNSLPQEEKKEDDQYMPFTRDPANYVEQCDTEMREQARTSIDKCCERTNFNLSSNQKQRRNFTEHDNNNNSISLVTEKNKTVTTPNNKTLSNSVGRGEEEERKQCLMFLKVLLKYLEKHDKKTFVRAKAAIKECYIKHKAGDPMFQSLPQSLEVHLRSTVEKLYWGKAYVHMNLFLQKREQHKESARYSFKSMRQSLLAMKSENHDVPRHIDSLNSDWR